jgi:hypothetical protein
MWDNKRLLDVLLRHQILLEGVKAGYSFQFNEVLIKLSKELNSLFLRLDFQSLDRLNKKGILNLLRELQNAQQKIYSIYYDKLIKQIRDFVKVDNEVSKILLVTLHNEARGYVKAIESDYVATEEEANEDLSNDSKDTHLFPISWFTDSSNDGLFTNISNTAIAANGLLLIPFIKNFIKSASNSVQNQIYKDYVNKSSVQYSYKNIIGSKSTRYTDGVFRKLKAQSDAVIDTVLQHSSGIIQGGLGSAFQSHYRWVSVMDRHTTEICKSRNGKVYLYGAGPFPPAHIRCRSAIIPWYVGGESFKIPSYSSWLKSQPIKVQEIILGKYTAEKFREGIVKADDFNNFNEIKLMSLEEFKNSINLMLTR